MTITQFGGGTRKYTFPQDALQTTVENFADAAGRVDRLPGLDGGLDGFGAVPAPKDVGRVTLSWVLVTTSRSAMDAARDAVRAMASWGVQPLWKLPTDPTLPRRRCRARVVSIAMPEQNARHTDLHQPVTVTFQVTDPRWLSKTGMLYLDDGLFLDAGLTLTDPTPVTLASLATTTATNGGTAPSKPVLTIAHSSASFSAGSAAALAQISLDTAGALAGVSPVNGFGLRQINSSGQVVNSWWYNNTLASGESLTVDCGALAVIRHTALADMSDYGNFYLIKGFGFPTLEPGANTLELFGTFTGNLTLTVEEFDAWA